MPRCLRSEFLRLITHGVDLRGPRLTRWTCSNFRKAVRRSSVNHESVERWRLEWKRRGEGEVGRKMARMRNVEEERVSNTFLRNFWRISFFFFNFGRATCARSRKLPRLRMIDCVSEKGERGLVFWIVSLSFFFY